MANLAQSTAMSHNGFRTEAAIVATTAQDSEQENEDASSTTADDGRGHEDALATPALFLGSRHLAATGQRRRAEMVPRLWDVAQRELSVR